LAAFKPYLPGYGRIGRMAAFLFFTALLFGAVAWLGTAPVYASPIPILAGGLLVCFGFWLLGRRLSAR
jgi:hypothetical protein